MTQRPILRLKVACKGKGSFTPPKDAKKKPAEKKVAK